MDWRKEASTWPLSEHSEFVVSAPHRWHVQDLGRGPVALLLHGAGGATQSFRHLAPLLAKRFRVVMPDLPGQGFTELGTRQRSGLRQTTRDIERLLDTLGHCPEIIVAHSAGAAIGLSFEGPLAKVPVVGINPALGRFEGAAGWLFPMLAKILSLNPFVPGLFARMSRAPSRVESLLASTGSQLDPAGTDLYRRLMTDRTHIDATLLMMAQWDIDALLARLSEIQNPGLFLLGARDGAVPNRVAISAAERLRGARVEVVDGQGHLMHETAPELVADAVFAFAQEQTVLQLSSA